MGAIEDRHIQAIKDRKDAKHAESERNRLICRDTYQPQIIALGQEFLRKMEAADYPDVTPSQYKPYAKMVCWQIGEMNDHFFLYSDGSFRTEFAIFSHHLDASYEQSDGRRVYTEDDVAKLARHLAAMQELVARIPAAP